jgi:LCP family protein required for cell wall assembly
MNLLKGDVYLQETRKKRRKRRSSKRIIAIVLVLLLVAGIVGASYYWFDSNIIKNKAQTSDGMMVAEDKVTIMIMGVDSRADDVGRSDTLMVATVDPNKKKAAILSIPRDTRVKIEGNGYDKINHAYAFGGHKLTQKTVEDLLGVPIDYYIVINIQAFERVIDAIGGVDINVEKRMYYEDPWDDDGGLVIDLKPGQQHMDGKTAIQYVRYRDSEGDIGRIARQQHFMKAVLDQIISPSIITKLPAIIKEVSSAVQTDMSTSKMISLVNILKDAHDNGLNTEMVPGKPAYIQDISYWIPDIQKLRQTLAELLDVKMDAKVEKSMNTTVQEYEASLPKNMKVADDAEAAKTARGAELKAEKVADDDKKNKEEPPEPKKTAKISVRVINSSGINGAGAEVAGILRRQGLNVTDVLTGSSSSQKNTTITAGSGDADKFSGLPFIYSLNSGGETGQATVVIGKDYK